MSVSPTTGRTSPAPMPSASASCMAIEVREPPISVEPSTRLTVPSALTLALALDFRPQLNQKPDATPRPLGISDFGFRISDLIPKSEVRNPKSEIGDV